MPERELPPNPLLGLFGISEDEARMTAEELAEWTAWLDAEAIFAEHAADEDAGDWAPILE